MKRFVAITLTMLLCLTLVPSVTAAGPDIYIVVQKAPPLSLYQGGIAGLAPTNPEARGELRLDPESAASLAYLEHLRVERAALVSAIEALLLTDIKVEAEFDYALNGFATELTPTQARAVQKMPGVAFVHRNETLHTMTDAGPGWMNADDVWDGSATTGAGTKGERVVVGIIDTGVNSGHPSFAEVGPVDGYRHENPRGRFYGVCATTPPPVPGSKCNNKLIGMYDFTGSGEEDDVGHGSHTASTTAGNVVDAVLHAPTITVGPKRISGVAPHANIISYKACFAGTVNPGGLLNLGSCPITALLASIDQATADVVDVINFSIGGGSVDPWTDPLGLAFFGTQASGTFVAASAGNSGPNPQTIGRPSNSPWVMSVGASTHDRRPWGRVTLSNAAGETLQIVGMSVTASLTARSIVDAADLGNDLCQPFSESQAAQIANKVVVCTQGVIGRVEKGANVKAAGGAGMVLVTQPGGKASVVADTHVIPTVMISEWDAQRMRKWLDASSKPRAALAGMVLQRAPGLADRMAYFSSRGPDLNNPDVIKPDVTAPGVAIWAAYNDNGDDKDDYNIIQGTSMSSPHAAGAAALVRAVHQNWNPDQVKSALMSTGFRVKEGGRETSNVTKEDHLTKADPFDRGGGRIDVARAVNAGFVVSETVAGYQSVNPMLGGDPSTLNLASLADSNCQTSCSWTRTITNTSDRPINYQVRGFAGPGFMLEVTPSEFTLDALHAPSPALVEPSLPSSITVTITATITTATPGNWNFGEVVFEPQDAGVPAQHFPVAVKLSGAAPAADCEIPETVVGQSAAATNIPDHNDIRELGIAGVYPRFGGQDKPNVAFRMTVEELGVAGELPPNQHWRFAFAPPGAPDGTSYFVQMTTNTAGNANFVYGTLAGGSFTTLGAPDAASYDLETSTIRWSIAASKIADVAPGDVLTGIAGASGAAQPGTLTTNLKTVNGTDYTLSSCGDGTEPTPSPTASTEPSPSPSPTGSACTQVTVWSDDLEPQQASGWTTGTADNAAGPASPTWAVQADPMAHSATNSWVSQDAGLPKDDRLFAPTQEITSSTKLSFWHRYFLEEGFDGGVLEISTDAGETWADVTSLGTFVKGGYSGTIDPSSSSSAIAGRDAWTGGAETAAADAMTEVVVDIGKFVPAGESSALVMVRWRLVSDELVPGMAWWIDDISFTADDPECAQ